MPCRNPPNLHYLCVIPCLQTLSVMKRLLIYPVFYLVILVAIMGSCKKNNEPETYPEQSLIYQMRLAADSVVNTTKVPGVVALVVDRKKGIDWLYATGVSDITNKIPANGNMVFRIGSCTKTLTITVLLQLVGEGKLSLNDKLSKFFPAYPKVDSVTMLMLCNMTSRIHDYFHIVPSLFETMRANPTRVWSPEELIGLGFQAGYDSTPGKGWGY